MRFTYQCVKRTATAATLLIFTALFNINSASAALVDVANYSATVTAGALNVRSGPSSGYRVIGTKYSGQTVTVTHHDGSWRKIAWSNGSAAYVYGSYLKKSSSTSSGPVYGDYNVSDYYAQVTASSLNVRSGPSTNHSVIGRVYGSRIVKVTHHNLSWRKISWSGGRAAYVHGGYLRKVSSSNPTPTPTPTPSPPPSDTNVTDYTAYVKSSSLNVRNGPGTQHSKLSLLGNQAELTVTHHNGKWGRVIYYGDKIGYVHLDYIAKAVTVDITDIHRYEDEKSGAADQYIGCMIGKHTSAKSVVKKFRTLVKNGIKAGVKKILTSPMLAVNHVRCAASTHDWSVPPGYSPQAQACNPATNEYHGCKELEQFYKSNEGIAIYGAFVFTASCDKECRLTCYFHGKEMRTYQQFIDSPRTKSLKCRY